MISVPCSAIISRRDSVQMHIKDDDDMMMIVVIMIPIASHLCGYIHMIAAVPSAIIYLVGNPCRCI